MEIWTDEVFGPVVALVAFDSLDEAVELLNASQVRAGRRPLHLGPGRSAHVCCPGRRRARSQ